MSEGQDLIVAFFVASLGFKRMALYCASAIGSYLLAKCICSGQQNGHVTPGFLFFHPLINSSLRDAMQG